MKLLIFTPLQWSVNIITVVSNLVITIFLANKLGADNFGYFSLLITFGSFAAIFFDLGLKNWILINLSKFKKQTLKSFNTKDFNLKSLISSFISFFIILLFCLILFEYDFLTLFLVLFCFFLIIRTTHKSFILKSIGRFDLDLIWQLIVKSSTFIFVIFYINFFDEIEINKIFFVWILSIFFSNVFLQIDYLNFKKIKFKIDNKKVQKYFSAIKFFALIDLFTFIYFRFSIFILEFFSIAREDIGKYALIFKNLEAVALFLTPISIFIFKNFISKNNYSKNISKYLFIYLISGIIFSIFHFLFAELYIGLFFSKEFKEAIEMMQIISFCYPFLFINSILSYFIFVIGKEKTFAIIVVFASFLSLIFNFTFMPKIGIFSPIYGNILTEAFLSIFLIISLKKNEKKNWN